ncbi:MAG: radical SAM protein [bacterium]
MTAEPRSILLVNPSLWAGYRGTWLAPFVELLPPQNLLAVAAPLREAGHRVAVLDLSLESSPNAALGEALERHRPDCVGLTFLSPQERDVAPLVRTIRERRPRASLWLGGVGPTVDPEGVARRLAPEGIAIGEADDALVRVLAAAQDAPPPAGTARVRDGALVAGDIQPLRDDLDQLPLPALDLVRALDYRRGRRGAAAPIETSRGCVYLCTFCTKAVFGGRFRVKSPARVVEEMVRIRDLGYAEAVVYDDTFNLSMRRAREVADHLIAAGAPLPWNCRVGIRADRVDADLLARMRAAGCYRVSFGVESGTQAVLDSTRKGTEANEVLHAFELAKRAGIQTMAFYILGLPTDTPATLRETARYARTVASTFAKFNVFMPLPSTPDWDELARRGLLAADAAARLNFHRVGEGWRHPNLSPRQIRAAHRRAFLAFYAHPRRLARAARAWWRGPRRAHVVAAPRPAPIPAIA